MVTPQTRLEMLQERIVVSNNRILSLEIDNKYLSRKLIVDGGNKELMQTVAETQGQIKIVKEFVKFLEEEAKTEMESKKGKA